MLCQTRPETQLPREPAAWRGTAVKTSGHSLRCLSPPSARRADVLMTGAAPHCKGQKVFGCLLLVFDGGQAPGLPGPGP